MYDRIVSLGKELGYTVQTIEQLAGISRGSIAKWKTSNPRSDLLSKVAVVLNTTMDYLQTGEGPTHPTNTDEDTNELLQRSKDDPNTRILFDLVESATPEEIKANVAFLQALRSQRGEDE